VPKQEATRQEPKTSPQSERGREARGRAIRAIVFMNRLFEYETRSLDIGLAQYRLLLYLRYGPKRAGELATHASVTRPALSTLIAGMEENKLIRRSSVQADKRGVKLEITRRGIETLDRTEERFGRVFDEAIQGQNIDREGLLQYLGELCKQLTIDIESRVRPDAFDPNAKDRG
jgi:DNA-binding MarR family transcriptional regulator